MSDTSLTPATPSPQRIPTIYIDLTKSDIGELKSLKVGEKVKVTLVGKVVGVSMRDDDGTKTGTLTIESKDVSVGDAPSNALQAIMSDDS